MKQIEIHFKKEGMNRKGPADFVWGDKKSLLEEMALGELSKISSIC